MIIKYVGLGQDVDEECFHTYLGHIKEHLNEQRNVLCSVVKSINIVNMCMSISVTFVHINLQFDAIPNKKIAMGLLFHGI